MMKYPQISTAITHTPRPSTVVLDASATIQMSTSSSLLPLRDLEPPPNTTAARTRDEDSSGYAQFLLLGDSITQFGTLTIQAYLQTQYIRRLDIVNRGLSGYTAPMAFRALQKLLPATSPSPSWPHIKLVTVFFGANDACVLGQHQHVNLQTYVNTLESIAHYAVFQQQGVRQSKIVIITPPPVNEHQLARTPSGHFQRRAGTTSQYARAAREVGKTNSIHVLDFWEILMRKVGWKPSMGRECCCEHIPCHTDLGFYEAATQHIPGCHRIPPSSADADFQLADFLADGLHLTKLGYDILFWELMELIRRDLPECAPENLPFVLPEWRNALQISAPCAQS